MDEHVQREPVKGQDERREDAGRGRGRLHRMYTAEPGMLNAHVFITDGWRYF